MPGVRVADLLVESKIGFDVRCQWNRDFLICMMIVPRKSSCVAKGRTPKGGWTERLIRRTGRFSWWSKDPTLKTKDEVLK